MNKLTISIGCDHAGYLLKEKIINFLSENSIDVLDFGTNTSDSVDYPDYAHAVVGNLLDGDSEMSILICGTGNGICMTANKWQDIRAALCWNSNIAEMSRLHNNANVLCLPARFIEDEEALLTVKIFIETEFEGGRHQNRINKIKPTI